MRVLLLLVLAVLAFVGPAFGQGIRPLNEETYKQALEPRSTEGCEPLDPLFACVNAMDTSAAEGHYQDSRPHGQKRHRGVERLGEVRQRGVPVLDCGPLTVLSTRETGGRGGPILQAIQPATIRRLGGADRTRIRVVGHVVWYGPKTSSTWWSSGTAP